MDILLVLITLISLALAATMSFIAWRVVREERRRSEARVAALAAEIRPADLGAASLGVDQAGVGMFAFMQPVTALPRLTAIVLAGVLVVGVGAVLLVAVGRSGSTPAAAAATDVPRSAALPTAGPLELVALGHERDRDQLTVRGLVRNPAGGAAVTELTAVVFAYDRDGGFLATGRALAQTSTLGAGDETSFLVTIQSVTDVGRYRVSFRSGNRVVSHVDIRS